MGMAASQARLLCITARIHDVEYQAQAIQAAKVQLATQSDQVYEEYLEALDATTLTVNAMDMNSGSSSIIAATFNNLCSRNKVMPSDGSNYAIRNSQGLLVVEDEVEEGYYNFSGTMNSDDPYQFAMYMVGGDQGQGIGNSETFVSAIEEAEEKIYNSLTDSEKSTKLTSLHDKLVELTGSDNIYDTNTLMSSDDTEKIEEYNTTLNSYRKELYKQNSAAIYAEANQDSSLAENFNNSLFTYYVNIYNQIKACGGCVSINDYDGPNGDAANNTEWLQNMVKSGQFSIEIVSEDPSTGEVLLNQTSPGSDSCLTYTQTSTIDNRALAKAEAEYNHKLKQIDKKDEKFDLDLSKLETERSALTTEYESVKKVIEDNIDRTFGIFS